MARVAASSGYSACDHPKNFQWEYETLTVSEILREWREPGAKHYLVRAADDRRFRLTLDETSGAWFALEALSE
jgi:hypothetical protein